MANSSKISPNAAKINNEFEIVCFDIEAEMYEKGYLHPNGRVKTLGNMHEEKMPEDTFH